MRWVSAALAAVLVVAGVPVRAIGGQALPTSAIATRPSTFHPIRDFATRLVPMIVPPKGCSRQDFDRASESRVVPDVTGCLPGEVEGFIRTLLKMTPQVSPDVPNALSTPIIGQSPLPGRPVSQRIVAAPQGPTDRPVPQLWLFARGDPPALSALAMELPKESARCCQSEIMGPRFAPAASRFPGRSDRILKKAQEKARPPKRVLRASPPKKPLTRALGAFGLTLPWRGQLQGENAAEG